MIALDTGEAAYDFQLLYEDDIDRDGPFGLGSRRSWVPLLGEPVGETSQVDAQAPYHAYVFQLSDGRPIGYVRLPNYQPSAWTIEAFGRLIARLQRETEALVLDQVNTVGGSLFQMYALLSMLTDRPLALPQHQITIFDEDLATAHAVVRNADNEAPERVAYSRSLLSEKAAGRGTRSNPTNPLHLAGVERILPARVRYTKKLLVLSNELTFSAGEFLAAILQDNRRATLFGACTAGAGGCARKTVSPEMERIGIEYFSLRWTLAYRTNGNVIQGVGVQPDVAYTITVEDLTSEDKFCGYRQAVRDTLSTLTNVDAGLGFVD